MADTQKIVPERGAPGGPWHEDASHMPVLTGLRGFAALWVYLFHLWLQTGKPSFVWSIGGFALDLTPLIAIGFAGVPIFFVLSGFLLSLPFAEWQAGRRERPATGKYFLRRILRVFPAYYAQLAILIGLTILAGNAAGVPDAGSLLRHLAMFFMPPPLGTNTINDVWWTLPVEFSFYLALPVLAFLLKPKRWLWLLTASLFSMWFWRYALVLWMGEEPVRMRVIASWQLPGVMDMFGLGMLAALIHVNRHALPDWGLRTLAHPALPAVALALLLASTYWLFGDRFRFWADNPIFYFWTPVFCAATAVLILSGVSGNRLVKALFGNRVSVFLGLISYSLYLWHLPVNDWLLRWPALHPFMGKGFMASLFVTLSATIAVSTLSYLLIERPFMRWRR
jgi:peptidoglycan/LPS O-acetylase OafA/YrhL